MEINYERAIEILQGCNNVYVLSHQSPDGDTLGSAFALVHVLRSMGKNAVALCGDKFPQRYRFLYDGYSMQKFEPECIIAVDVADRALLGGNLEVFKDRVDLCIDHHISNDFYAKETLVNPKASATCEVLFELFRLMGVKFDRQTATCLYTGIATDTGCFKYENTTPEAHIAASRLMTCGVDYAQINRRLFDVKSRGRIIVEQYLNNAMEYYFHDRCAMIALSDELMNHSGMESAEFEGLASLTLQMEGVEVGVVIKEREPGVYKISMRSSNKVDVSALCQKLGGGGHIKAAGCLIHGTLEEVKQTLFSVLEPVLENMP